MNTKSEQILQVGAPTRRVVLKGAAYATAASFAYPSWAQASFPYKPIEVISSATPGGMNDLCARIVADILANAFSSKTIVQNMPGASTQIALQHIVKSQPDGYSLICVSDTSFTILPNLVTNIAFSIENDFAPIGLICTVPLVLLATPSLGIKTSADLVAAAKAKPNGLTYDSPGIGTAPHIYGSAIRDRLGIEMTHVPYAGAVPAIVDVGAGHVDLIIVDLVSCMPLVKEGRVAALAVATPERLPELPDTPTMAEFGIPDFTAIVWLGVAGRAGIPADVVEKLSAALQEGLARPEFSNKLTSIGARVKPGTPQEFASLIVSDRERLGEMIRRLGIKLEN